MASLSGEDLGAVEAPTALASRDLGTLRIREFEDAAAYFPECDRNSVGEQNAGLHKRRVLEQAIFLRGDYGDLSVIPFWRGNPHTTAREQYHLQPGDI